jgi:hypothetical protein
MITLKYQKEEFLSLRGNMKVPGSDGLNIEMSRYAWKEPTQK